MRISYTDEEFYFGILTSCAVESPFSTLMMVRADGDLETRII